MQGGEVVWSGPDPSNLGSRRQLSGAKKDSALWLKLVDAEEHEGERFNVYEECLKDLCCIKAVLARCFCLGFFAWVFLRISPNDLAI